MKNIRVFLPENFQFLEVKFSIYLNRRVLVMVCSVCACLLLLFPLPLGVWEGLWLVIEALPGLFSYLFLEN